VAAAAAGSVAFYSGTAGAFVELADDARWIFNLNGPPVLDGHLAAEMNGSQPAGIYGLAAHTDINQAVGVLIEEGHTPDGAREELARRSLGNGWSLSQAALQLLADLTPPNGSHPPANGSHPPANGSHPPANGSHPPANGSHRPSNGSHPPPVG
jgi:hypothetical protein